MNRKMEITTIVDPKQPGGMEQIENKLMAILDKMAEVALSIELIDVERSLVDIEHDLSSDCLCEGCKAFERLRNSLKDHDDDNERL